VGLYLLQSVLGRGGMATVYRAESNDDGPAGPKGSVVAVKVFQPELVSDENTFRRFQREAELGRRIRHPHVVRTFEIGSEVLDGVPHHYIAMELVEGQTLRDLIHEMGTLPDHLLYQVSDQALDALTAGHAEGMIHRDLKPENIVLTREHKVLLMDLGVARLQQEGRDLTRAGEFVGSLAYAAPEQFTDQDHVGPVADLYSFGVVLYEMATGHNPFEKAELSTLVKQKVKGHVRRPKLVHRDIEPFLDDVIRTCLQLDPGKRFASCEELREVLRAGDQSEWWQERIKGDDFPAAERAIRRLRPPREFPLIGRGADLDRLHQAYEEARDGGGKIVLLSGAAGTGKSRLVSDFLEELVAPDGPIILSGRSLEETDRAHQAFIEAAIGLLGEASPLEARLSDLLPDLLGAVPKFALFLLGEESGLSKEALASAYASLLRNLAAGRPVICVIEDLHRASAETVELFGHVVPAVLENPVLLMGTYREEDVGEGSELAFMLAAAAQRSETVSVNLEPLSRDTADELIRAVVTHGRTVRALGRQLYERSDGIPQILLEMLAHLRATGVLADEEGGLVLTQPLGRQELPANIRALFALKLDGLDGAQREVIEAASVQGPEFSAGLVAAVTGKRRIHLLKQLALLERKHRLLLSSGKDSFRFVSRGLHDVVYGGIPSEWRVRYHGLCAEALRDMEAERGGIRAAETAHAMVRHLLFADRTEEAGPYLADAVEYACAYHHPAHGAAFLERLICALPETDARLRFVAYMGLAALYGVLGRKEDRMRALDGARTDADLLGGPGPRGRVHSGLAAAFWRAGSYDEAQREAESGLALTQEAKDREGEASCLQTLGAIAYRRGAFAKCAAYCKDALVIQRAIGDRRGEAETLQALGAVMPETGEGEMALATKKEALKLFRDIGDRRGEGTALNNMGNSLVESQRLDDALACYEQAVGIAREVGDLPAEAAALYNQGRAYAVLARVDDAKDAFERALEIFGEIGDPSGEAEVLDELGSAIAAYGEKDEAIAFLESARESAARTGQKALLARVLRHLANVHHESGYPKKAWRHYQEALALASARGRALTRVDMGNAALHDGDFERAISLLEEGMEGTQSASRRLLSLCRLARAHKAAGRPDKAREYAQEAEQLLKDEDCVAPQFGPEVYYSLGTVFEVGEGARKYLSMANELLGNRTRSIRSIVHRQHYLTMTWPNREIIEEARRLFES
jgi:tetratricopeptide (TPR) repeat protein